jgi:hypothetical protein
MMRKFISTAVVLAFLTTVHGDDKPKDDKPKPPPPPKRHQGDGRIYEKKISASIVPPGGWTQGKSSGGAYLIFRGTGADRFPNVNVSTFANNGVPIQRIGASMSQATAKGIPGWKSAGEELVKVDGKLGYAVTGKYERDTGDRKEQMQTLTYYVQGNSRGYVISFLIDQAKFDDLKPTLEEMVKSFRCD